MPTIVIAGGVLFLGLSAVMLLALCRAAKKGDRLLWEKQAYLDELSSRRGSRS